MTIHEGITLNYITIKLRIATPPDTYNDIQHKMDVFGIIALYTQCPLNYVQCLNMLQCIL